ncbi:MAG: hypothetical protein LAT84_02850 [Balneolia bacterium]|nr:hypothetical protein [Balneolia bacterium]
MKTISLFLVLILLGTTLAVAQSTPNREIYPDQAEHVEHNQAVIGFSGDFVTGFRTSLLPLPTGEGTSVTNNAAQINISGASNSANISQFGFENRALISINGANNEASLTQDGNENLSVIDINGSNNFIDYTQQGNNNYLGLFLRGSNFNQTYMQQGDNHSVQMIGIGLPITVEQTGGAGMSVIITNE